MIVIATIAGAIAGGLVEFLLGLILPEKPTWRHILAIFVAVLVFASIAVWTSPEGKAIEQSLSANNDANAANILLTIQAREIALIQVVETLQAGSLEEVKYAPTETALARQFEVLKKYEGSIGNFTSKPIKYNKLILRAD